MKSLSRVRLLATPWTAAYQAPPSMGFSRQEYWSGVPLPSPYLPLGMWNLPGPGIEPVSPALAGRFLTTRPPGEPCIFFFKLTGSGQLGPPLLHLKGIGPKQPDLSKKDRELDFCEVSLF